ncbi:MAG: FecR domain-containing protein, partial [Prevotella sp.]|nr:FecR domain-containing protein [Prevotella sp.]
MQQIDINDILYNLLSGDLTEEDNQELENWLNRSPENRRRYEDLMNSDDFVSSYHAFHNIDKEKAWQQFRKQKIVRKPAILVPLLRVAAVVVFIIIGSYWYMTRETATPPVLTEEVLSAITRAEQSGRNEAVLTINGKQRVVTAIPQDLDEEDMEGLNKGESVTTLPSTVETVEGAATLVTRHDKEFWLTLDDGTRVHLNYNTSFTYPVHFNGKTREVELSGEAFFFVAKDQKRPFIVHTPQGDVRVYGTEFHVKTSSADREQGAVVLVKGSVGFTLKDGMETVIKPGQEIS